MSESERAEESQRESERERAPESIVFWTERIGKLLRFLSWTEEKITVISLKTNPSKITVISLKTKPPKACHDTNKTT